MAPRTYSALDSSPSLIYCQKMKLVKITPACQDLLKRRVVKVGFGMWTLSGQDKAFPPNGSVWVSEGKNHLDEYVLSFDTKAGQAKQYVPSELLHAEDWKRALLKRDLEAGKQWAIDYLDENDVEALL